MVINLRRDIILSTNEPSPRLVVLYITEGDKEDYNLVGDIPHASFKWFSIFPVLPPVHTSQSSMTAIPSQSLLQSLKSLTLPANRHL